MSDPVKDYDYDVIEDLIRERDKRMKLEGPEQIHEMRMTPTPPPAKDTTPDLPPGDYTPNNHGGYEGEVQGEVPGWLATKPEGGSTFTPYKGTQGGLPIDVPAGENLQELFDMIKKADSSTRVGGERGSIFKGSHKPPPVINVQVGTPVISKPEVRLKEIGKPIIREPEVEAGPDLDEDIGKLHRLRR